MSEGRVYIIGLGEGGVLNPEVGELVNQAEVLLGGERLLRYFLEVKAEKIVVKDNLKEIVETIKERLGQKRMVMLASGDPNFYGIARYMVKELGKDVVEIIPNVSSMQMAFAKIKEQWDDAVFTSVHSRPIEDIVEVVRSHHKVGIFTDPQNSPSEVAKVLLAHSIDNCSAYVCSSLGEEDESIIEADLSDLVQMRFPPLNVLILIQKELKPSPRILGIPDEVFRKRREGLITKLEVRAVVLAKLGLTEESVVWDIGAGSGAISIEASFIVRKGYIFAIEKNALDREIIEENIHRLGASRVEVVSAFAPEGLDELPDPTAVFIGGSGGKLTEILKVACPRLLPGGNVVLNIVNLESLNLAAEGLRSKGLEVEVTLVSVARSLSASSFSRLQALNPVFIVRGEKSEK